MMYWCDSGDATVSTTIESHHKNSTSTWCLFPVQLNDRLLVVCSGWARTGQFWVRSNIQMDSSNTPFPQDFTRIQYWITEIAGGHFHWKVSMKHLKHEKLSEWFILLVRKLHFPVHFYLTEQSKPPAYTLPGQHLFVFSQCLAGHWPTVAIK